MMTTSSVNPTPLRPRVARWAIVANLVAQVVIVVTGGAVRLSSSGLGCSQWPQCEPGSFTPVSHKASTLHPYIEFGNRTLTGVLILITAALVVTVTADRTRTRGLRWLAAMPLVGVVAQAVIGGITVLLDLNPGVVAVHMLVSLAIVATSTALLLVERGLAHGSTPALLRAGGWMTVTTLAIVLVLGTVTSGAGPHSGDDDVAYRFAVDPFDMARVHAASVWAFLIVVMSVLSLIRSRERVQRTGQILLFVAIAQGAIGYVQTFSDLPVVLVNLHMLGAALLTAAAVPFVAATFGWAPVAGAPTPEGPDDEPAADDKAAHDDGAAADDKAVTQRAPVAEVAHS